MPSPNASTMKQWITDFSGLANLRQEVVPIPEPGKDEVLVKVGAVSLNFRDVEGKWPIVIFGTVLSC